MNWAARETSSPLLCFVNDDTEVRGADWLDALVAHVSRANVAAVGAKLLFPTERIQHGGIVVGSGIVAAHAYRGDPDGTTGYHDRALVAQEVSAVTAACMLVRREAFESVGGFDEQLAIAFNDIDLCLRLRGAGWRIVWTPEATMYHKESLSLGRHDAREREWKAECELMFERWGRPLTDPHHNPNLSRDALRLWEPR
jgi:GT2 family glycosyltransferase